MTRAALTLALLLLALPVAAQDAPPAAEPGDATLHVLRPVIHAEQDQAEICLEFDHSLDPVGASRSAVSLKLEAEGKPLPSAARNWSIDGAELCLPNLEHRKEYHLSVASLRAADGAKLDQPYSLSFTVPARHAALAVLNSTASNGALRWGAADPVLRAVNIDAAKLELFRITDPAQMADAWGQRLQTTLAPSESATYARSHGSLVWQGEMALPQTPQSRDRRIEAPIPLGSNAPQPPGLYLLVASAPQLVSAKNILAPVAAAWLLRSGLHINALAAINGIYVTADYSGAPMPQVRCLLLDRNDQIIAEARSGADGVALLTPPPNRDVATVMGLTAQGDADFADATQLETLPTLPAGEASLVLAKPVAAPGEMVEAQLAAHDIHGQNLPLQGSSVQLQRADHSVYESFPVSGGAAATIRFPAPATGGLWHLAWRQANGVELAAADLAVSANPAAPHIDMTADRLALNEDGEVNLTLKSAAADGKPVPYIAGSVTAAWAAPGHLFPGWDDYRFGTGENAGGENRNVGAFVTDAKGTARLHLKLSPPADAAPLHAVALAVKADPAAGVVVAPVLTLPMRPGDFAVGVRPQAENSRFAENSLAKFDIVALDADGKRRGADGLSWQIYQQGRSFDWRQQDGRWDYKPLPQQRRIGGGPLQLSADAPKRIEFPVTAGAYRLDIADADGKLRARVDFSAGWGLAKAETPPPAPLALTSSTPILQTGVAAEIRFTLPAPALVTAIIADDQPRRVLHLSLPTGANTVAVTPEAGWGNRLGIWVTAVSADGGSAKGRLVLPVGMQPASPAPPPVAAPAPHPVKEEDHGFAASRSLIVAAQENLAPQHIWQPPAEKTRASKSENRLLLIAAQPLTGLPQILSAAVARPAFTTAELAGKLDILRLWHSLLIGGGWLTEAEAAAAERELALRLLARQQSDGGFNALPGGPSDLAATAAALTTLSAEGNIPGPTPVAIAASRAALKDAVAPTADWLRHRLENTWFNEAERPARAAAYAAMAAADRLDGAALHYFADTTLDQNLPPVAAAQLSAAFVKLNDRNQAQFWLNAAHAGANPSSALLGWVMNNPYADASAMAALLIELAEAQQAPNADPVAQIGWLRAMAALQSRGGLWHTSLGRGEIGATGVYALPQTAAALPALRNTDSRTLYASLAEIAKTPPAAGPVTRRLSRLDGGAVKDSALAHNETIVVTLDGPWPTDAATLMLTDAPAPLRPVSCALQASDASDQKTGDFLGWLRGVNLSRNPVCESSGGALSILLPRGENAANWRIAYLAQAEGVGAADIPAPVARFQNPAIAPVTGAGVKLHIR